MALSFEESKKQVLKQTATPMPMSLANDIMEINASEVFSKDMTGRYAWFDAYIDNNISIVDANKGISVNNAQVNISQESNSQFIPFEMDRKYDGIDLKDMALSIHFTTSDGQHFASKPVNVEYSENKIRFAWLVDTNATHIDGNIKFEIHADGLILDDTKKEYGYRWKSQSTDKFNILKSLCQDPNCEPVVVSDDWVQEIVENVAQSVADKIGDTQINLSNYYTKSEVDTKVAGVTVDLTGYATKNYVDEKVSAIDVTEQLTDYAKKTEIPAKVSQLENDAGYLTQHQDISGLATKDEVEIVENKIPSIEGLATEAYVNEAVAAIDVSDKLKDYAKSADVYTKNDVYTKSEIDEKVSNVEVDLSGYYTKSEVDTKTAPIETNTSNISSLSTTVAGLQTKVDSIDTSPKKTYDVVYNDAENPDVGENVFVFYEIENEGLESEVKEAKKKFTIVGGGGSSASSSLKIEYITKTPIIATMSDSVVIKYNFTGTDSSGDTVMDGTATWKVAGRVVATNTAVAGENSFDITDYISLGTQKVTLSITDDAGSLVTKTWTVQKVDVRLESTFNDNFTYPLGAVEFSYTPYGAISKTVHFMLDGVEIGTVVTSSSGIPAGYTLPAQKHGAHLLEVYMTAEINGNIIESNHIYKDILWYDDSSTVPVIGCVQQNFTVRQYDATNIIYTVYDPTTETPTVTLSVDGVVVSTLTIDSNTQTWQYKTADIGAHVLTITCRETIKTLNVVVEELDINIEPVTAGLEFDFNPSGRSNNDADRLWSNGDVSMTVSDNFDWVNGGYQIDVNGDQYFCVKSGTTATINYNLFADDPKKNGKEFKVVFKTTNVKNRATSFISCMNNNIGLDMKIEDARIYSSNNNLYSPYCEDDIIEFEFNINKNTDIPMVLTYEDGVGNRPMIYTADASFMQSTPQPITIGSEDCDVYIYRMKAYSTSLTDRGILSNFIADARNADEMVARYNRNQIYDENGLLDPYVLAEKCPNLRIILVDAPWFTNDKSNKVSDTNITMIYKNGDPILDNWTCTGARHSGQGTSSNEYGYSGRNMDLIMDGDSALFTLGDGTTTSKTITLTRNSTPTDYLNVKVNIASSENQNNAQMTMRFNEYQPYKRTARLRDSKIRDCMEFYNCVVFIRERNEDVSTHREFTDTAYHYYALGNVGDSKKTDDTRVNDKKDPKECCIEIMDYNVALAEFPTGNGSEICPVDQWKAGNTAYDYLYAPYKYKDGEFKSFGSESYEFRYEMKGITEEQRQVNIDAWREAYKFVVTSTDEEFYTNFSKYFVLDSILYFYLFTERYTMVDNRAKNCFLHRGKVYYSQAEAAEFATNYGVEIDTEYIDDEQATFNEGYRWDLTWGYDFDTALGISNTGKLEISYGKEDIDYYVDGDPTSSYIFRAAGSNFFCRVRDLFSSELQAMFVDRENANAWSADGLISQWDNAQNQFPEEIWRLDIQRKYLRTYQGISIDNSIAGTANPRFLVEMLNGRKRYQRRMFERNQELYMATKYFGNKATQDQIMMRFNNPVGATVQQDFTLYLTPYSDMYIGVKFGNVTPTNFRAKAGVEYTIPYGIEADTADITLIYGASFIQAIGDLSKCYVGDNDFSKASRLQSLIIGSDVEGYTNTYMTKISLGNNKLLEYLDVKNVSGLNSVIDLSKCNNLLELHAEHSGATGVIFSNGGKLKKAYLPSIISLTMKNLSNIEAFEVESYNNLQTLIVENTPFVNTYDIVNSANKLNTVRLIGLDWNKTYNIADSNILERLLIMRGVDNDGYDTLVSILAGAFYCAVIKQKQLENYNTAWPALEISYNTLVPQYTVTFMNQDGKILDVQYVDKGTKPVDPITRQENPIPTPTLESTISTNYTFVGWDTAFVDIFADMTILATYTETTRMYTVKYVSNNNVLKEIKANYGTIVTYDGELPTYTAEESAYKYYLFDRWDQGGFVNGDKTINAVYDSCEYTTGYFVGKELADMRPVEIYMLTKLNTIGVISINDYVDAKDPVTIQLGNDFSFSDIEENVLISEKTIFNGTNYVDTGIKLLSEDRDFVLAIDCKMDSGNSNNAVLAQCFSGLDTSGFKLLYSNGVRLTWGSSSNYPCSVDNREMIVLRHVKGETGVHVYASHVTESSPYYYELSGTHTMTHNVSLVFGCNKLEDGSYEQYARGTIYWSKIWYADLGDSICKQIAYWPHEEIGFEACCESNGSLKRYYLSDNSGARSSIALIASNTLSQPMVINASSSNSGGWANYSLNTYLNNRVYEAFSTKWKQLIKQVKVKSSVGENSEAISNSDCYIFIPAIAELYSGVTSEPYISEGTIISHFQSSNQARICYTLDGDAVQYWTRSPTMGYSGYVYRINNTGAPQSITPMSQSDVYTRIMICI